MWWPLGYTTCQLEHLAQSNDNADIVLPEDGFKFIGDLSVLQIFCLSGLLADYDFLQHLASDFGIDDQYLPPDSHTTKTNLNYISNWIT